MASFGDKVVGTYHFLTDRPPKNTPLVAPKPRAVNPWCSNGQAVVAKVMAGEDIKASIDRVIALLGHLGQAIEQRRQGSTKAKFQQPRPISWLYQPSLSVCGS